MWLEHLVIAFPYFCEAKNNYLKYKYLSIRRDKLLCIFSMRTYTLIFKFKVSTLRYLHCVFNHRKNDYRPRPEIFKFMSDTKFLLVSYLHACNCMFIGISNR